MFREVYNHDAGAHLDALREGGDVPVQELEKVAEAFGIKVDLCDPRMRQAEAWKLHIIYGMRSTMFTDDSSESKP